MGAGEAEGPGPESYLRRTEALYDVGWNVLRSRKVPVGDEGSCSDWGKQIEGRIGWSLN